MTSFAAPSPHNSGYFGTSARSATTSWSDPQGLSQDGRRPRSLPHIKDILSTAVPEFGRDIPLNQQLEKAEAYVQSSQRANDFHRPDIAYKDYLRGYEVAVQYIPRHRDFGFQCDNNKKWEARYTNLCRALREMENRIEDAKKVIQEDNARSGVRPNSVSDDPPSKRVYSTGFGLPANGIMTGGEREPAQDADTSSLNGVPESLQIGRAKPATRPKPDYMSSKHMAEPNNDLSQRFARLRMPVSGQANPPELKMPSAEDYQNGIRERPSSSPGYPLSRPSGPREMSPQPIGPSVPPKVPLSISMPKPPSPTYSPSKVSTTPLQQYHSRPPLGQSRPHVEKRPTYYNQPVNYTQPPQLQRTRDENPYRPRTPNGSAIIAKSSSSEIPLEPAISATTLKEYIHKYNVLLIDVRERELFDEGHIFASSILCIEPVALNVGVSAEELEDRLVVSPENEHALFGRRHEFDIVVYYDQKTESTSYLSGAPAGSKTPALRALYDTLHEFNDYKRLKDGRPPALLLGGIDAWVDLMGSHSLATSKTAATLDAAGRRPATYIGRSLVRQRMVSANSSLEVRKRRLREYKPLNADEEQAWRQKAQQEEVDTNEYAEGSSDGEQVDAEDMEPTSPFVHDYEAFLRTFPDISVQQSMVMPTRRAQTPTNRYEQPHIPQAPSRPAPAIPRPSYSGQADINQSQAPLARTTSATRPALYSSGSLARRMKLPRTGLTNFGVTCYMNSTLQCLSATIPLSQFFLEDRYKGFVQGKNWKGSSGIMPELYANVVRSLWKSDVEVIKPSTFRNFCGRMNREWVIDRQQDAKEFFDYLVDCLHEDLNVNWSRTQLRPLTAAEEMQRERLPIPQASSVEWSRFTHRDYSLISSLFAGQHASRLRCTTCRNTSTTYEAFYSISIEIPKSGQGDIYSCLRSYTQEEMLSGDEVWKCPHCKCEREATKQIILTRLPQFLVIHFKRFSASKTESARKIHTPIDFPLHGLNMDSFVIQRPTPVMNGDTKIEPAITPPFSYDAYGVLRHLGNTGNGGHYISMVKDPGRGVWRKYDDERSIDFEPKALAHRDRLQNGEAYIVFYQRAAAR